MGPLHLRSIGFLFWCFLFWFSGEVSICVNSFREGFPFLKFYSSRHIPHYFSFQMCLGSLSLLYGWYEWSLNLLFLSKKDPSVTLPTRDHHGWGLLVRLYRYLFYPACYLFSFCCGDFVPRVFRFISKGIIPGVVVDMLCLWEMVSSGSSYASILNPLPQDIYFFKNKCV